MTTSIQKGAEGFQSGDSGAQRLKVQPLEAPVNEQAELVIMAENVTDMTGVQFILSLPAGLTLSGSNAIPGSATSSHSLNRQTLANGDHLFILYSMNLDRFNDGVLLRIPINMSSEASSGVAKLSVVRFSDTNAVSYPAAEAEGIVTGINDVPSDLSQKDEGNTYNLSGMQIASGKELNRKLPKGIYLTKGKKTLRK